MVLEQRYFFLLFYILGYISISFSLTRSAPKPNVRYPNIATVVHSYDGNRVVQRFMGSTFLRDMNVVIMTGNDDVNITHFDRRFLKSISYNGHPGNGKKDHWGVYKGIHRPLAGIFAANASFPDVDWIFVIDDDSVPDMESINAQFLRMDPTIPFLLGLVGK
jgi:hypothetical protein